MPQDDLNFGELAQRIRRAAVAHASHSEEALKMDIEPLLREALQSQGIEVIPQYEQPTLFRGRQDAVYGQLILEYERPGRLNTERGLDHTAGQLQGYIEAAASASGPDTVAALRRLVGVGLDGERLFFFRYWPTPLPRSRQRARQLSLFTTDIAPGGFQVLGPYLVTEDSVRELFTYFRSLTRDPLRAERLAEIFGPNTDVANKAVGAFYAALTGPLPVGVETFRRQWEFTFGVVYGQETATAEKDVPELAAAYGLPGGSSLRATLFAVHTYFALLMKLLTAELLSLQPGSMTPAFVAQLTGLDPRTLLTRMMDLEGGGIFHALGVQNFLEGDFFRWYLDCWSPTIADAIRTTAAALARFEPATPRLTPEHTRDLLKRLYQYLVPRKLRHDLGEYYTPDWLAERLLNQLGYNGDPDKRLLDPACGSGTFLTLAVSRARAHLERDLLDRNPSDLAENVEKMLNNIVGFDLNPLAVIAARTNYLLALGDLLRAVRPIHIPVYLCDSILTPTQQHLEQDAGSAQAKSLFDRERHYRLPSSVGPFVVPEAVVTEGHLGTLTSVLEECVSSEYTADEFMLRIAREVGEFSPVAQQMFRDLYLKLQDLEAQGRNGIWARLLRNSFAPVLQGKFDYVVGNPPWVNWESLAEEWRDASKELWQRYGLFTLKGHAARLGGGKKDLSMLFVYVAADVYLKPAGRLGFVITQTLFKTKGAGDGFRRLQIGNSNTHLRVQTVEDLTELQPFEGATNQTAIIVLTTGPRPTTYPVPYTLWRKTTRGQITQGMTLDEVQGRSARRNFHAQPVAPDRTSPWLTARRHVLSALQKVIGKSPYVGFAGACTWLNGVYWVRILERRQDGLVVVENLPETGRTSLPVIQMAIEPHLLYPLVRGRDIHRWSATASAYFLLAQDPETRSGWSEHRVKVEWPQTYRYLKRFEAQLTRRSGLRQYFNPARDPFWSIYNVGSQTMATYKVMWRQMVPDLAAAVTVPISDSVLGSRVPITQHVVTCVAVGTVEEAHFLASVMNSSPVRLINREVLTGKSRGTPGLLDFAAVPGFDPAVASYRTLATLGAQAAERAGSGKTTVDIDAAVDELSASLWGLSAVELRSIQQAFGEGREAKETLDGVDVAVDDA